MNTDKIVKETKTIMLVSLLIGLALLEAGIMFSWLGINLVPNNRALVGLSFIPLSVALMYYVKLVSIRKSPQKMHPLIISESDERLVALKNEANAQAFRILQAALFLTYMGYTLMVPADIFESIGWWILLGLLLLAFISQGWLLKNALGKDTGSDENL